MPVMPAGVHLARDGRRIGLARGFLHRQRIHIRAQPDHRPRFAPVDHRHDAGFTDPLMHLIHAEFAQTLGHIGGGFMALEPDLGMHMQVAPPCRHFICKPCDTV